MTTHQVVIEKTTSGATYAASASTLYFGYTANDLAAFIGCGIAVATFLLNWWFKYRHLKLTEKALKQTPGGLAIAEEL